MTTQTKGLLEFTTPSPCSGTTTTNTSPGTAWSKEKKNSMRAHPQAPSPSPRPPHRPTQPRCSRSSKLSYSTPNCPAPPAIPKVEPPQQRAPCLVPFPRHHQLPPPRHTYTSNGDVGKFSASASSWVETAILGTSGLFGFAGPSMIAWRTSRYTLRDQRRRRSRLSTITAIVSWSVISSGMPAL